MSAGFRAIPSRWVRFVEGRTFLKNVIIVAGGTAAGQGLAVLAAPVLTRLYSPSDFGVLAAYSSVLSLLLVVAGLRYELAIPLPEDEDEAFHLLVVAFLCLGLSTVVSACGVWVLGDKLAHLLRIPELRGYLWLLPVGLLGAGAYQILNYWAVRCGAFGLISRTKLSQGISQIAVQLGFGVLLSGSFGLVAGDAAGRLGGSGTLLRLAFRQRSNGVPRVSFEGLWRVATRYRNFPLLSSLSGLLNAMGLQLPPLLLTTMHGPGVSGSFSLSQRLLAAPLSLVGMAVSQVFVGELARLRREEPDRMAGLYKKTAIRLFAVGLVPIAALGLGGPVFFPLVFGEEWGQAGVFVRTLSIMLLAQFVVVPLSQTLNILERQAWQLAWDAARLVIVVGTLFMANWLELGPDITVVWYGLAMLLSYLGLFVMSSLAVRSAK